MADSAVLHAPLSPHELTRPFVPEQFNFVTTEDLEPFRGVLGQERAVAALQFGVAMPRAGYNVYVMGEPGTGRFSFVQRYLKAEGKRLPTPEDWVYVNHFDEPREPRALVAAHAMRFVARLGRIGQLAVAAPRDLALARRLDGEGAAGHVSRSQTAAS